MKQCKTCPSNIAEKYVYCDRCARKRLRQTVEYLVKENAMYIKPHEALYPEGFKKLYVARYIEATCIMCGETYTKTVKATRQKTCEKCTEILKNGHKQIPQNAISRLMGKL